MVIKLRFLGIHSSVLVDLTNSNSRQDKQSSRFVPVPRPREGEAAPRAAMSGQCSGNTIDRWLSESANDQPFNTIAFVQQASTTFKSTNASKTSSSLSYITPSTLFPEGNVKS